MFRRHNARPTVKKVSTLVDKRSHKQRKYISLMLVPSYSSGRTRSLRIPRVVFYCILFTIIAVAAVTAGLYLRSERFADQYRNYREFLHDTQDELAMFRALSEDEQSRLMEKYASIYAQLTEEQHMARIEQNLIRQAQQDDLNSLLEILDELEQRIFEFDYERRGVLDNLSSRTIIPPVEVLYNQLMDSQVALMSHSSLLTQATNGFVVEVTDVAFASFEYEPYIPLTPEAVIERITMLLTELEIQELLLDDLQYYRQRMDSHLRNFPSLWPISAQISSNFGWRQNPMGGRGTEFHSGIDLRAPIGTNIRAAGGGTVTFSGRQGGYGNVVIIDHGHWLTTLYAHNSVNLVSEGQRVERGDIIARVGVTGRTTGPHVHYEVRENGVYVNPRPFMLEHWN